jgi:hypothetical protein
MPPPQDPADFPIHATAPELADQTLEGDRLTQAEKDRILYAKQLKSVHIEAKPAPPGGGGKPDPGLPPGLEGHALYQDDSAA